MNISHEKPIIVLEFGHLLIKAGFSGEIQPRKVLQWKVYEQFDQNEPLEVQEWEDYLLPYIHHISIIHLQVCLKGRRVTICEDVLAPRNFRRALANILFNQFQIASLNLVHGIGLVMYATGYLTALVIDCGWKETRILPIYRGNLKMNAYTTIPIGTRTICNGIELHLREKYPQVQLHPDTLRDIIEKCCCFSATGSDERANSINYNLSKEGDLSCSIGEIQKILDELFRTEFILAESVLNTILSCAIDTRKHIFKNMILVGGTAMISGFQSHLGNQMEQLISEHPQFGAFKSVLQSEDIQQCFQPILFPQNIIAWIGGSIYSALNVSRDAASSTFISLEHYSNSFRGKNSANIPDWMSISTSNTD